jgi:hypothetical protein
VYRAAIIIVRRDRACDAEHVEKADLRGGKRKVDEVSILWSALLFCASFLRRVDLVDALLDGVASVPLSNASTSF